jgi:hypothetical protein
MTPVWLAPQEWDVVGSGMASAYAGPVRALYR